MNFQLNDTPDVVVWKPPANGISSITSYYNVLRKIGAKVSWDKFVWVPHMPHKYSFCHWLLRKGVLKTRALLVRRGVSIDKECPFCSAQEENFSHLFFQCQYSRTEWSNILFLGEFGIHRNSGD